MSAAMIARRSGPGWLSLVDESRESIVYGVGADMQVRPELAHDGALRSCILCSPLCQELGQLHLVCGRSGLRCHGVVPAESKVSGYAVGVMLDGLTPQEGSRGLEGGRRAFRFSARRITSMCSGE